jgi:hypothetical protein
MRMKADHAIVSMKFVVTKPRELVLAGLILAGVT